MPAFWVMAEEEEKSAFTSADVLLCIWEEKDDEEGLVIHAMISSVGCSCIVCAKSKNENIDCLPLNGAAQLKLCRSCSTKYIPLGLKDIMNTWNHLTSVAVMT